MLELQNFVNKFHQLRQAGFTAHLDVDAHAGQAWVRLHLMLESGPIQRPKHTLYATGQELVLKPKFFSRPPIRWGAAMKPILILRYIYKKPIFAKISFFRVVQKIWHPFEVLAIFT